MTAIGDELYIISEILSFSSFPLNTVIQHVTRNLSEELLLEAHADVTREMDTLRVDTLRQHMHSHCV